MTQTRNRILQHLLAAVPMPALWFVAYLFGDNHDKAIAPAEGHLAVAGGMIAGLLVALSLILAILLPISFVAQKLKGRAISSTFGLYATFVLSTLLCVLINWWYSGKLS